MLECRFAMVAARTLVATTIEAGQPAAQDSIPLQIFRRPPIFDRCGFVFLPRCTAAPFQTEFRKLDDTFNERHGFF